MSEFDFATRIKRIEAELMALKIAHGSGSQATVYDSEITITQGGVTKGSFTVNQSTDETIELDAGGGGSEPNDGTLTIQRNGTNIATFTANQAGNSTANITVPTTMAELSDSGDYIKESELSSSTSSTSTTTAANSRAVKSAYDLAATKSTVSFTQGLSSGSTVGTITIDGTSTTLYAPSSSGGSTVSYSPTLTSGTIVGSLTIDGVASTIFAPTPPTTVAQLSDAANYALVSSLSTVATSGSYADLSNKPSSNLVFRGTCSTATATAAKVATLDNADGFSLTDGVIVAIKFANSNLYSPDRTLNVNGTGAKEILDFTLANVNTHDGASIWQAGETVLFTYIASADSWERVGGAPTYLDEGGYWDFSIGPILVQSGTVNATSSATSDLSVTFRRAYANEPRVILTNKFNESGASLWWAFTKSISTTGFVCRAGYTSVTGTGGGSNASAQVSWIAIGRIGGAV